MAHLKDMIQFEGKLEIFIQDSQAHTVLLSGTGTTVAIDRPFRPGLDLGKHFR